MDRVELRNLLLHKQLPGNILVPLGYNTSTFDVICEVVEAAILYEQKKGSAALISAVKKLKELNCGSTEGSKT